MKNNVRLGRVPGKLISRPDVNFVLVSPTGVKVGTILDPSRTENGKWMFTLMNDVEVTSGSGPTLSKCHDVAEKAYNELISVN